MDRLKKILAMLLVLAALSSLGGPALADAEPSSEPEAPAAEPAPEAGEEDPEAGVDPADAPLEEPAEEPAEAPAEAPLEEPAEPAEAPTQEPTAAPEELPAAEPRPWTEPGNLDAEIRGGGVYLRAGDAFYYSDGGIWRDTDRGTALLTSEYGRNLNLCGGWLYYTDDAGRVRRIPGEGGAAETVYETGAPIDELYVLGPELRYLSEGAAYSYDLETQTLSALSAPARAVHLIPTPWGDLYLTGSTLRYSLWAGTTCLRSGVEQANRDGDWLVLVTEGRTWQAPLSEVCSGVLDLSPYALHSELLEENGLTDERQLQNEADFLQSEEYALLQDGLSFHADGAYTETNSRIAATAYTSSSATQDQKNIVLRSRQMAEIRWTPLNWRYSWGGDDDSYLNSNSYGSKVVSTDGTVTYGFFRANKTYVGIPYSQAVYTGYVGWSISLSGYVEAVNDSSSKFYSGYSHYSRTAPYYGSDCSGFASWAWDLETRCTCTTILRYCSYIGKSLSSLRLGDVINNPSSHIIVVTNIGYDADGNINAVEITEQTPCKMRVTCYGELFPGKTYENTGTLSSLVSRYLNGSYSIYRRDVSGRVTFTESDAVNLVESGYAAAPQISVAVNEAGTAKVVTLTHQNVGAVIYYTTDGSAPSKQSAQYTGPFSVTKETTVRAIAALGKPYTGSYELKYTIRVTKAEKPFIVLLNGDMEGQYVSSGSMVAAVNTAGDTIRYTTDGSAPTVKSPVMPESGVKVTSDMTLRAIAVSASDLVSDAAVLTVKLGTFYGVTASAGAGGYITPGGRTGVLRGSGCTFDIVPLEHFAIKDVLVDGKSVGARTRYTFENVTGAHTISATFSVSLPFTDVKSGWYVENVAFAYSHDLFAGTSSTKFSPNDYMTRGMFITVLGRFAGNGQWKDLEGWSGCLGITGGSSINIRQQTNTSDTSVILGRTGAVGQHVHVLSVVPSGLDGGKWYKISTGSVTGYLRAEANDSSKKTLLSVYLGSFSDLPGGAYYTGYAQWAYMQGIMSGVTETSFCPNQFVRRQDICVMFYRYMTLYLGRMIGTTREPFKDDSSISSYARTAVYAMKNIGVVGGYEDGTFRPNGYATRAEVATMFANLYKYLNG